MAYDPFLGATVADRFEIDALIRAGGMGAVYRGRQHSLSRDVAIKVLRARGARPQATERFIAEARTVSKLAHPHIVSIFDFGREVIGGEDVLYLVMELLRGCDLRDVLDSEEALPIPRVIEIVSQILGGLAEAHHHGIVHRDIKPENVLLVPRRSGLDHVKIIDFGVARHLTSQRITEDGITCGTIGYLAPEQAGSEEVGPHSDVYSAGVVLFELLTRREPFYGPTPAAVMLAHIGSPRPDPRKFSPERDIPASVAHACMKAMAIRPEDRFSSASDMELALRDALRTTKRPEVERRAALAQTLPFLEPMRPTKPIAPATKRLSLVGRDAEVEWARSQIVSATGAPWIEYVGPSGSGKTRLFTAIAEAVRRSGIDTYEFAVDPEPLGESTHRALARIIERLSHGLARSTTTHLAMPEASVLAREGLRTVVQRGTPRSSCPQGVRRAVAAALAWAARCAAASARSGCVTLLVDGADRMDAASLRALADQQREEPVIGFTILLSSERDLSLDVSHAERRTVANLSPLDAARLAARIGAHPRATYDRDVAPLHVVRAAHMCEAREQATLEKLLHEELLELEPRELRILQAIAVAGVVSTDGPDGLIRAGPSLENVDRASLDRLLQRRLVEQRGDKVVVAQSAIARAALELAAPTLVAELHHRAALHAGTGADTAELRAYHAIRGHAGFEAFLAVEDAVTIRARLGNDRGVIDMLSAAVRAARALVARAEGTAASTALSVFGRKLASALASEGELEEAERILIEILALSPERDLPRALVLEQLGAVSTLRGRREFANARFADALEIAESTGDHELGERVRVVLQLPHDDAVLAAHL